MRGRECRSIASLTTTVLGIMAAGTLVVMLAACGSDGPDAGGTAAQLVQPTGPSTSEAAAAPSEEGDVVRGSELFGSKGCAGCHGAQGQGGVAPRLAGVADTPVLLADGSTVTADEAYLLASILTPQDAVVAGYTTRMPTLVTSEADAIDLVAFIRDLPDGAE